MEMLMKGTFKKAGDDAFLFVPLPISDEDLPCASIQPGGKEARNNGGPSAYEQAWINVSNAVNEVEIAMRQSLETAMGMRNFLLGSNPTPEKMEEIDHMFREQGYLLLAPVEKPTKMAGFKIGQCSFSAYYSDFA
ncbi:MAG: hypothetical protein WAN11_19385 [Syntrophobacteraceae bacterium]